MKQSPSAIYQLDEINRMDKDAFVAVFGGVFEDSPWVAETAWRSIPFDNVEDLVKTLFGIVRSAGRKRQLALLRAHPELGVRKLLTGYSAREQQNAGLGQGATVDLLPELNQRYRDKFGFPFILAVKGLDPSRIITRLRERLENSPEHEFSECLEQVFRIATFRLEELIQQPLVDSAELYAEIYENDGETQEWTEAALSDWPE